MDQFSLKHHFLIATPALQDSYFQKSLIYICDHTQDGAMGVIINKRSQVSYGDIMGQLGIKEIKPNLFKQVAISGGPVDINHGFVIHNATDKDWKGTIDTGDNVKLTSSKDILDDIATSTFSSDYFIGLGYSGWGAGQLESEILENSWLTCPADESIIFNPNYEDKFDLTCKKMGINWVNLSMMAGHA